MVLALWQAENTADRSGCIGKRNEDKCAYGHLRNGLPEIAHNVYYVKFMRDTQKPPIRL